MISRKAFIRLGVSGLGAAALSVVAGCGGSSGEAASDATAEDHLAKIQEAGKIIFATEGTWAPETYHDENDELVGYDVDVARAIAEKLGVEAEFAEGEWDGLFAGVDGGRYDSVANGVDVTEERAEKYDFTTPYSYTHTVLIVAADNDEITSFEDLEGKQTANTVSSTYAQLAESYGATNNGVDDFDQTISLLTQGRIDATLNAETAYHYYMTQHPEAAIKIAATTEDAIAQAFPVPKGEADATLLEAMDAAIDELRADGTLTALSEQYFGTDISVE